MSNADLTQYNGSQAFPASADVGTNADQYLVPTDGKLITALSNIINEAPVNVALHRLKDYVLGLRGAIIGDFAFANRKSLHSILVDSVGGSASPLSGGIIQTLTSLIVGPVGGPSSCTVNVPYIEWTNPAHAVAGTSIKDRVAPANTARALASITTDGLGGVTVTDNQGITGAAIVGGGKIQINYVDSFLANYQVLVTGYDSGTGGGNFAVMAGDKGASFVRVLPPSNPATNSMNFDVIAWGRQ